MIAVPIDDTEYSTVRATGYCVRDADGSPRFHPDDLGPPTDLTDGTLYIAVQGTRDDARWTWPLDLPLTERVDWTVVAAITDMSIADWIPYRNGSGSVAFLLAGPQVPLTQSQSAEWHEAIIDHTQNALPGLQDALTGVSVRHERLLYRNIAVVALLWIAVSSAIIGTTVGAWHLIRLTRTAKRLASGQCTGCGYQIDKGSSAICPECGAPIEPPKARA